MLWYEMSDITILDQRKIWMPFHSGVYTVSWSKSEVMLVSSRESSNSIYELIIMISQDVGNLLIFREKVLDFIHESICAVEMRASLESIK